jgi:glycerate 2-kinase
MKKLTTIVIAPDSFKGSLSAMKVGTTIRKAFLSEMENARIEVIPMADGGEGTLDTLVYATGGQVTELEATGPLGERVLTAYGITGDGKTAVIEMASVAGLPMISNEKRNPMLTTTYGVGEILCHALDKGYRSFIIGLGGSATNDGGCGMLQALGAVFLDKDGRPVESNGGAIAAIESVDFTGLDARMKECTIRVASDVENPLCGPNGASYVFGPQKGAAPEQVQQLDQALAAYANLVEQALGKSFQFVPGAGAAGGLGFALLAVGAQIESGANIVAEATGLEQRIQHADWVITGEGRSDFQTLFGKVPSYVAKMAQQYNVRTVLLSGGLGQGIEQLYEYFVSCHSIVRGPATLEDCMQNAETYLFESARDIARLINSASALTSR